ncbi:MAG: AAA family ATPase [Planctomycetes bacterium]|nr:AAA family ATPase [Planctomycetota bacterium]
MKLAKLRIENFRHLGSSLQPLELDFTDALGRVRDLTLLVGPNTSGKTTILDAIAAALGPTLEMPTLRPGFKQTPRRVVRRGALHATVTCWLRFSPEEIAATRELFQLADISQPVPDAPEVTLTWTYPDPKNESDYGFTRCVPLLGWTLLKGRVQVARLLATGRVDWSWFQRVGGVFTFDQERTGLGKSISRQVWNIIHGTAEAAQHNEELQTTDPRTLLIDMALRSLVPSIAPKDQSPDEFQLIQERYARVCVPRRIVGAVRDELGEFDVYFSDGENSYTYDGLSSGEKKVLLLLIRFVAEYMHQSLVLIDELELNQHQLWQGKLAYLVPRMGEGNQIIATTHAPYVLGGVEPEAVIDLGNLGKVQATGAE